MTEFSRYICNKQEKVLEEIRSHVDERLEELMQSAVDDYFSSAQFEEDAMAYCRENGWREP